MSTTYNIYCDESCHLEHDKIPLMLFGAVWCPLTEVKKLSKELRQLKAQHNAKGELKWKKVSKSRLPFYLELVNYFCSTPTLNFRAVVVLGKDRLNHSYFNQGSHDSFYYKMYYQLLRNIISGEDKEYNLYLDIKDTRGSRKIKELVNILHISLKNSKVETIKNRQLVRSHESELIQLTDFLIGAVAYENRDDIPKNNMAKAAVIEKLKNRLGVTLRNTSPPWENKFNLFIFRPRIINNE